jgi:hypothetical protein
VTDPGGFDDLHARINASAAIYQNLYANYTAAITDAAPGTLDQVLATLDPIMTQADAIIDGLAAELAAYTAGIAARMVDDAAGYTAEAARIQAAAGGTLSAFELAARIFEPPQEPPS